MAIGPLLAAPAAAAGPHNFVLPPSMMAQTPAELAAAMVDAGALTPQQLAAGSRVAAGRGLLGSGRIAQLAGGGRGARALSAGERVAQGRGIIGSGRVASMTGASEQAASAAQAIARGEGIIGSGQVAGMAGGAARTNAAVDAISAALGSGGGGAAEAAAGTAARGGLLSRLPGFLGGGGGAAAAGGETAAAGAGGGLLARLGGGAALKSAGMYAGLGYGGGQLVEMGVGHRAGTWDDAARNAAVGAGFGAGIGTLGGPFAPISVPVGAAGGALIGGAYGFLTGKGSDEDEATKAFNDHQRDLTDMFAQYNVSPETQRQIMMSYELGTMDAGKGEINDFAKEMQAALPSIIQQDMQMQTEQQSRNMMLMQAQSFMAPMMQSAFDQQSRYGQQLAHSMMNSAGYIKDPADRAFAIDEAKRIPFDTATQQAYQAQMMMSLPGLYGYNTSQGQGGAPQMDMASIMGATPMTQYAPPPMMGPAPQQQATNFSGGGQLMLDR